MSQALHQLTISEIACRNLRSADMFSKNDVYVVFRCGTKKTKTKTLRGGGKNVEFSEMLTMNLTDQDLEQGLELNASARAETRRRRGVRGVSTSTGL